MNNKFSGAIHGFVNRIRAWLVHLINSKKERFIAVNAVFAFVALCLGVYFKFRYGKDLAGAFISVNLIFLAYICYYRYKGLASKGVHLIFLLLFTVFNITVCCEVMTSSNLEFIDTPKFLLNFIIYGAFYCLIFLLSNSSVAAVIAPSVLWGILATVNYFLNSVRGRPLFLSDLFSIKTGLNVASEYKFTFTEDFVILWVFMIFTILHSLYLVHEFGPKELKIKFRFRSVGAVLVVLVCVAVSSDTVLDIAGVEPYFWTHRKNGFPLNFIMDLKYSNIEKADDYSSETIESIYYDYNRDSVFDDGTIEHDTTPLPPIISDIVDRDEDETDPTGEPVVPDTEKPDEAKPEIHENYVDEVKKPNVIVIMNETFSDMRVVGDFNTNKPVMPFIDSLKEDENAISGYSYVSVFGGGTADSEYEFLTGDSMYIYAQGAIPYQLNFKNSTYIPSIVETFNTLGYETIAMHPYLASGWNRPNIYAAMQYDQTHFIDSFNPDTTLYYRNYISDESSYDKIIELYEKNEEKGEDIPFFMFNVTMQNHGGYGKKFDNFKEEISLPDYPGQFPKAEQYLSLMHESDKAVEKLITYFKEVDEPTVILFFGDHQGTIEDAFYELLWGKSMESLSDEEFQSRYMTKFFIWANYELNTDWMMEGEDRYDIHASVNYLSPILFRSAGLPTTAYQNFLLQQRQEFPIISAVGVRDCMGGFYSIGDKNDDIYEALRTYEMLIYNHVFDKKNTYLNIFSLLEQSAKNKKSHTLEPVSPEVIPDKGKDENLPDEPTTTE